MILQRCDHTRSERNPVPGTRALSGNCSSLLVAEQAFLWVTAVSIRRRAACWHGVGEAKAFPWEAQAAFLFSDDT